MPGQESGRLDPPAEDSALRDLGQALLTPPRVVFEIATAPIRTGAYVYERYQLVDRYKRIFFDDTYTYGAYPTLVVDGTYGVTIGGRAVHRNLFGAHERAAFRAGFGGEFRERAELTLRSGERFGATHVELRGELEQRPADAFYGIGNSAEVVEARHRQEVLRATTTVGWRTISHVHVLVSGALTDLDYGNSTRYAPIDEVYNPMLLTGFTGGMRNVYGELELRWDNRRLPTFDRHAMYERGVLASVFGGRVHQLGNMGDDYWRYGGELQAFIPLGIGPRVLMTRVRSEAVTGDLDDVAFTQLPQLGGVHLLRGYPRDRFRDRMSLVSTVEYTWDLNRYFMASAFVDVGRVYPSWRDLHYEDLRVGYGMALQMHYNRTYIGALSVATSRDGGWFVDFVFDPVFDIEPRVVQR